MLNPDQAKWDKRYQDRDAEPRAASVLKENLHLLPKAGKALDLACGLGGNALLLAEQGLDVEAWDISPVAIDKLNQKAAGLTIHGKVIDITAESLAADSFDVIVISYFLDRDIVPAIIHALKPGGLLFYQTFNQNLLGRGPGNPGYRLQENELLRLFAPLVVRFYREEEGSDEAILIAQK